LAHGFVGQCGKSLDYVTSLSEKYQSEVHVLYVIEQLAQHEPWYGDFEKSHVEKIQEWEQKTAKKRLDEICENFLKGCPLYIKHTAVGDPAQEILGFIDQGKGRPGGHGEPWKKRTFPIRECGRKSDPEFSGSGGGHPYRTGQVRPWKTRAD
jgi:hypothetical protein